MQVGFVVSAGFLRRHFQVKSSTPASSLTPRSSDKRHFCCTTVETDTKAVAVRLRMSVFYSLSLSGAIQQLQNTTVESQHLRISQRNLCSSVFSCFSCTATEARRRSAFRSSSARRMSASSSLTPSTRFTASLAKQ